jgi:hypothetical protein
MRGHGGGRRARLRRRWRSRKRASARLSRRWSPGPRAGQL